MGTIIVIIIIATIIYSMANKDEKELQTEKVQEILSHDEITPAQRKAITDHWYSGGNR